MDTGWISVGLRLANGRSAAGARRGERRAKTHNRLGRRKSGWPLTAVIARALYTPVNLSYEKPKEIRPVARAVPAAASINCLRNVAVASSAAAARRDASFCM